MPISAPPDRRVFPASKRLVRKAISSVCQLHYCVDSFVVVFKTPSLSNGDLLLWDSNGNGRVSIFALFTHTCVTRTARTDRKSVV